MTEGDAQIENAAGIGLTVLELCEQLEDFFDAGVQEPSVGIELGAILAPMIYRLASVQSRISRGIAASVSTGPACPDCSGEHRASEDEMGVAVIRIEHDASCPRKGAA